MIIKNKVFTLSFVFSLVIIAVAIIYSAGLKNTKINSAPQITGNSGLASSSDVVLPVTWGDLGKKMVETGVIDANKFEAIYEARGGLSADEKALLYGTQNGQLVINSDNSAYILNLLWAFGLGNKNDILEKGEMTDPKYGGAGNFASTGGWTIADGNAMEHYSKHVFIKLTSEQQDLVDRVSRNIYRPCCGNSTHFPDCNHGMAMFGLLELMASNGVNENDMYKYALKVNELWFPDTYATIDAYLKTQGLSLDAADPKEILGINYSSAMGYQNILKKVAPVNNSGGNGCGV